MAQVTMVLTAETDLTLDAIDEMARIHQALARRHGDWFRQLERRIETLLDDHGLGEFEMIDIGEGHMVMTVPSRIANILTDADALGITG